MHPLSILYKESQKYSENFLQRNILPYMTLMKPGENMN